MEHWFDDLTKRLAPPGLSRREIRKTVTRVLGLRGGTTDHTTVSFAGATLGVTGPAVEVYGLAQ
jgi:hypothetical protein